MKLLFTKPVAGKTTVTLDDRTGITGIHKVLRDVDVKEFKAQVGPEVEKWAEGRRAIYVARELVRKGA